MARKTQALAPTVFNKSRFGVGINRSQYHPTIARLPREFQAISSLGQLDKMGWAKLATYYYDVTQFKLPMTPAEFQANFSGIRRVFSLLDPNQQEGRQTNTAVGSGVNEIFVAVGAGIVSIGEDLSFAIAGGAMDRPASEACTPGFADCVGSSQAVDPSVDNPNGLGVGARNATLWFGGPTWRFIDKMYNHYRLQIYANRRFQMVDESLFDVGMVPAPPEFIGASSSNVPVMPFVRATNDTMSDKGIDKIFLAPNFTDAGEAGSLCRSAQLAPVTWGHTRISGLGNRLYCFNTPLVMIPGMQFDVELVPVENDICNLDDMKAAAVFDSATPTTADAILTETLCNGADAFASEYDIPGGCVHIGVVLKGFALQPQACVEYLLDYVSGGGRSALAEIYGNMLAGLPEASAIKRMLEQEREERTVPSDLAGHRKELHGRLGTILQKAQQQQA